MILEKSVKGFSNNNYKGSGMPKDKIKLYIVNNEYSTCIFVGHARKQSISFKYSYQMR